MSDRKMRYRGRRSATEDGLSIQKALYTNIAGKCRNLNRIARVMPFICKTYVNMQKQQAKCF